MINKKFWNGKKILLTGNTGFKGGWLNIWLNNLGAEVIGYSLESDTSPNLFDIANIDKISKTFFADIRNEAIIKEVFKKHKPEIVIHMAAQPLVRKSYYDPIETIDVNVVGTSKVIYNALITDSVKAILNVTSDKCYENREWVWGYRENERMGGHDPYSCSKGCSELITNSLRKSFNKNFTKGLASARAGNVIGGGDWSEDRLIPDILRALSNDKAISIRNPYSIRPWQHVLDPLYGYLLLIEKLFEDPKNYSDGWNFGPNYTNTKNVEWILKKTKEIVPKLKWSFEKQTENFHEANFLMLDATKANKFLNWKCKIDVENALKKIMNWHESFNKKSNMYEYTVNEITNYEKELKRNYER